MNVRPVDSLVFSYEFGFAVSFLGPADTVQRYIRGSVVPVGLEARLSNLREPQVLRGRNHIYGANTNTYTLLEHRHYGAAHSNETAVNFIPWF